jgi:glutamate synthase (NADPH/NADH) small chain
VGGLLIYGIPGFKLEKSVVGRREKLLRDAGVTFTMNTNIGTDISFAALREKHDAVLIATGVYQSRDLSAEGDSLDGIVQALDYLTASNRTGMGDKLAADEMKKFNAEGRHVVVVGGGDTAMDCVRTAVRQKAKSVSCLYRRDRENMPGSIREVMNAEEEGVVFDWLTVPDAFTGKTKLTAIECSKIHLGQPDTTGRRVPEVISGSAHSKKADLVIKALGFDPEDLPGMFNEPRLKTSRWGTINIDWQSMMTSLDGVFAAGDIVRGASLVVWAVRDGRDAAEHIDLWLRQKIADADNDADKMAS